MRKGLCTAIVVAIAVPFVTVPAPAALAIPSVTVDTFVDTFDGSCTDGDCSLRDAIAVVDDRGTVRVPPGFYALMRSGTGSDAGDLDLTRPVTIVGTGETGSFLDASGLGDRVFDVAADVRLRHLTLLGGTVAGAGGIVRATGGSLRVTTSTLSGGHARDGGAVAVGAGATATIDRSWIGSGVATARGGGLYVGGTTLVSRSTISESRATAGGGAFVALPTSLALRTATVSGNVATRGGGIRAWGNLVVRSSTIGFNRADVGGGLMVEPAESFADGSLLARNEAGSGPTCVGALNSGGHNVADGPGCRLSRRSDLIGVATGVRPLRQYGGPTPSHAIAVGSPAVGFGALCGTVDQRGAPRHDCDSGAYELVFCLGRPVTIVGTPGPDDFSGGLGRDVFLGFGGADEFQGSLNADRACGGGGNDRLIGGPGNDRLRAGVGDDVLLGEAGEDLLIGGRGRDICRGGLGADVSKGCEVGSP